MGVLLPMGILGAMGAVFGVGLAAASKVFEVKVDERVAQVREFLPGANCAACGYSGCDGYAEAVVSGEAKPNKCPVGGQAAAAAIAGVMGVEAGSQQKMVARVRCLGTTGSCGEKYEYNGIADCTAASLVSGGPKSCTYGCMGFGSCVKACQFDAIYMYEGIACVSAERCTACGQCVQSCPKSLIELVPEDKQYIVSCMNRDKGGVTRKACSVGCIGCMRCVKACEYGAVTVENNLAVIDYEKCQSCGECVKACPQSCINLYY